MTVKSFPTGLSLIAASLALRGCGLLGGNPTQGVGIKSKNCLQNIAVDPSLSVAYLTMPDSNTILTVPLPGTGSGSN
jgi:hypothetical protein